MKNKKSYGPDEYTYEDYLKDFELDYLGFDGVPDKPIPEHSSAKPTGDEPEQETDAPEGTAQTQHPSLQNQKIPPANSHS